MCYFRFIFAFAFIAFLGSCTKEKLNLYDACATTSHKYLFIGHIYGGGNSIDERVEKIDFTCFDKLLIGGDVCANTTESENTMDYVEKVLHVSSYNTHWARGNHDLLGLGDGLIDSYTGRPSFYVTSFDDVNLLVLNSNFNSDCAKIDAQYTTIKNLSDTIASAKNLIVISHHMSWQNVDGNNDFKEYANANHWHQMYKCGEDSLFFTSVYPLLQSIKNKGINVFVVAGDFGQKLSNYSYKTSDGLYFLGSGITNEESYNDQFPSAGKEDMVLVFVNDLKGHLKFEFKPLSQIKKVSSQ